MKRFHVITITFLAGLMVGAMVPQSAQAKGKTYYDQQSEIVSVDPETCTIELDSGDTLEVGCDEMSDFKEGQSVTITRSGQPIITDHD